MTFLIKIIKKIFVSVILLLLLGFGAEVLTGYYHFIVAEKPDTGQGHIAIMRLIKRAAGIDFVQEYEDIRRARLRDERLGNVRLRRVRLKNPFVKSVSEKNYKFHPIIGFTGINSVAKSNVHPDYFGYRNDSDIYFDQGKKYKLVVITGGSEVAGYSHTKTIAQNLETLLNKGGKDLYKVINLGTHSYCLIDEIKAYTHLVYHLQPEFVISHTGWNDMLYGTMIPKKFTELGLNYVSTVQVAWQNLIYQTKSELKQNKFNYSGFQTIVPGFIQNILMYQKIVKGNNGRFIVGIQPYSDLAVRKIVMRDDEDTKYLDGYLYARTIENYEKLHLDLGKVIKFVDFSETKKLKDFDFFDNIHTENKATRIIAMKYRDIILNDSDE